MAKTGKRAVRKRAGKPRVPSEGNAKTGQICPAAEHHRYKPIESYGVIGDLNTVALVAMDGSIDWCCLPYFDSPSVFGSILDAGRGGYFKIAPDRCTVHKQMYLPESCVLVTRFLSPDGVGEVTDFMTVKEDDATGALHQIIRIARVVSGSMKFKIECFPAFDYARSAHGLRLSPKGAIFEAGKARLSLSTHVPLREEGSGCTGEFVLRENETKSFILRFFEREEGACLLDCGYDAENAFRNTMKFWRDWVGHISYRGRWREMVQRSAMTLKLLTFNPTGAIVAAPTTSLPETLGGARNFDYRYTWIRDSAFSIYSLLKLGLTSEAEKYMTWIDARARESEVSGELQIMYGIHGQHDLPEIELDHLEGYRDSRPVRIGNAASNQLQLDIYGELMDAVFLADKHSMSISYELWTQLWKSLDYVCRNWMRKDEGIWEVRGGRHHFVYSKLMCWVALDRGIRLSRKRSFPSDREKWYTVRDRIYQEIMTKGWNEKNNTFVQHYGTDALDASNLIMPLVNFISPSDPRMLGTIEATMKNLAYDSLVHRYEENKGADDGFSGEEGSFSMCSFWLVECLTHAGRLDEARLFFEKMHSYANHLGLYSEEIGATGEHLGNFPQAFTHLGLISAALNLDQALGE